MLKKGQIIKMPSGQLCRVGNVNESGAYLYPLKQVIVDGINIGYTTAFVVSANATVEIIEEKDES